MAYINVAEWTPDQVTDWLKGLDNSMYHYIHSFTNNEVRGQQLLQIRPYELEQLGMYSIGHQEIVLEAVEHLRNFHHHLDKENLQFLALHIATASQCLHNQLARCVDRSKIETQCLSDVTRTIATIKPLIGWLDRAPFHRINRFVELRNKMLRFAFEMATMAQRDRFVENPVDQIKQTALRVAKLANYIIQDVSDVMILQPATLNLVTLKKKESELGFNIVPSASGIHVITDIKYNSPAHTSGKIEDGDEIVQINYQTVVGWHYKKVIQQLHESPPDILLTLKKRPKHSKIYGQIYMKPYRLPSKKRAPPYRWGGDGLPSPRVADLLQLPPALKRDAFVGAAGAAGSAAARTGVSAQPVAAFPMPAVGQQVVVMSGSGTSAGAAGLNRSAGRTALEFTEKPGRSASVGGGAANTSKTSNTSTTGAASDSDDCSDIMTPTNHKASNKDLRLYLPKTRAVLQRRNTICGDHVTGFKSNVMFWHEYKDGEADSPSLRDKSVSFGFGLEIAARPTTYLGIGPTAAARFGGGLPVLKGSLPDIVDNSGCAAAAAGGNRDEEVGVTSCAKPQGISKLVRFDSSKKCNEYKDNRYACNVENTILEVFEPIPYVDEEEEAAADAKSSAAIDAPPPETEAGITQAVNEVLVRREIEKWEQKTGGAKLASPEPVDTPPAIEPRSDFLHKTPPAPPPRPRKLSTIPSSASFHGKPQYAGGNLLASPPANNPQPSTLPKPSPRHHLHITEPIREPLKAPMLLQQPIPPQPIYNSQQQLQLSESFLQPDPNNDLVEYNNTRAFRPPPAEDQPLDASTRSGQELPAEILELVTPNKTKNLTLKKKNSIMAKRRNITLKTLEVSDIQGHLYRRTKDKHGVTYWAKLYMVLADTSLYGFRAKDSDKADCLIFLNGFTVSLANEVHSKPFAFKVYHPSKTFYFAAESQMALAQWIEYIRKATLKGASAALDKSHSEQAVNLRELFSETESSDGEMDFGQVHKILGTPSPLGSRFAHKKSFCGSNASNLNAADDGAAAAAPAPKSEKYHLGFGSLKKFSWSSSASKAAKAEKKLAASSSDVPVPTAQFRSYRKVPGNAGLQLGTNSMISSPVSAASLQAAVNLDFSLSPPPGSVPPTSATSGSAGHDFHATPTRGGSELSAARSMSQATKTPTPPPPSAAPQLPAHSQLPLQSTPVHPQPQRPRLHQRQHSFSPDPINLMSESFQAARDLHFDPKKLRKNAPYHYIHASNPNLVEFDFSTAKTLDWTLPKMQLQMSANAWETSSHHHHHHIQHHHSNSLQGFVTLKDLMLQKQEDDAKEMYNNRVTLGVEKKLDPTKAAAAAKQALRDQQLQQLQLQQQPHPLAQQQQQHPSSRRSQISIASTAEQADNCSQYGGSTTSKIQSRSLPKTPDYAQSFKPDDSDIIMTRSREGQKLRDFGYEFISGDDAPGAVLRPRGHVAGGAVVGAHQLAAVSGLATIAAVPPKKKGVGLNWMGGSSSNEERAAAASSAAAGSAGRSGSVKKTKSDKLFQFKHSSSAPQTPPDKPLKPSFLPLTLPSKQPLSSASASSASAYKQPATHVYNMHGQARLISPSSSIDESGVSAAGTYRSTAGGLKKSDMSSPTPSAASIPGGAGGSMFNKLTFGAGSSAERKTAKEKKLLGSPRLHRALFGGSGGSGRRESDVSHDHEPFMPMEPKPLPRAIVHEHDIADIAPTQLPPPTPHRVPNMMAGFSTPEYPNLEYPPVFEPETYSLNDPNASLTLLRRRNQPNQRSK